MKNKIKIFFKDQQQKQQQQQQQYKNKTQLGNRNTHNANFSINTSFEELEQIKRRKVIHLMLY